MSEADEKPDEILHPKKRAFLAAYSQLGNISAAARIAGISRQAHYEWLAEDEGDYRMAFGHAREDAIEAMEAEARRRAVLGVSRKKLFFHQGEQCGELEEFEYSDLLLMFLLKAARPDVYRDRQSIEHSGPKGGPIQVEGQIDSEIEGLLALLVARAQAGDAGEPGPAAGTAGLEPLPPAAPLQPQPQLDAPLDGPAG